MCSRYENEASPEEIAHHLAGRLEVLESAQRWSPQADHRPTSEVLILRQQEDRLVLDTAIWGFKLPQGGGRRPKSVFNTRVESLHTSSFWRGVEPCWLPLTAWIEWPEIDGKGVLHRLLHRERVPFVVAGVWGYRDEVKRTSMMMQPAPEALAWVHDRAPIPHALSDVGLPEPVQIYGELEAIAER